VKPKEPVLGAIAQVTAQQVADYLNQHPDFFVAHAQLLSDLNVPHPQSGQAISLVERQASVLRERIKILELKLAELLRNAQENDAIAAAIQAWVRGLLLHQDNASLPQFLTDSLAKIFSIPLASIVIWQPAPEYAQADWVVEDSADYIPRIDQLMSPVCGLPSLSTAVRLLPEAGREAQSVAVIPLRVGAAPKAFGVLCLGSPDARRFAPDLGVAFLEHISEIASAALSRVTAPPAQGE
jgi:uncharacterized protein